ncbi:MAG TPA: HEAT repeat domain-containing protein [Polyangiaceae bacterium]
MRKRLNRRAFEGTEAGLRVVLMALALALPQPASAQSAKEAPRREPSKAASKKPALKKTDLDRFAKALEGGSEPELLATLAEIRGLGPAGAPAAPHVEALLARGSSVPVLLAAFETGGALGEQSTSSAIAPYVQHRNAEIRAAAAQALGQTKGPAAISALRKALGSADPAVRSTAAGLLGWLGARDAVPDLFTVLAHDTPQAALSIALLCAPEQCDRLMALLGKLKFETLEPAFVPLMIRPSTEVPEEHQLRYVDRLRRLATPSAQALLTLALSKLPESASPKLRRALDAASKGRPAPKEMP